MDIKSTARERLKAYLDGLSEKQRRGILVAMLAFTCVASGIVLLRAAGRLTPARERMELPFGEGSLTDTLRRLPDPLKGQVTSIYRTINNPSRMENRKSNMEKDTCPLGKPGKAHGRRKPVPSPPKGQERKTA